MGVEVEGRLMEGKEALALGGGFLELADGDLDEDVVAFGLGSPEAFVEHPVRVGTEGEAVAGVVVAALGVLVDVTGLDKGGVIGFQAIAGQGAGEVVAEDDVGLEAGVAAFLLAGFELTGVLAEGGDLLGFRKREAELFEEHDLFPRCEVEGG